MLYQISLQDYRVSSNHMVPSSRSRSYLFSLLFPGQITKLAFTKKCRNYFRDVFRYSVLIMPPKPKISVKYFPKNEIQDYETLSCFMKDLLQKSFQIRRSLFI